MSLYHILFEISLTHKGVLAPHVYTRLTPRLEPNQRFCPSCNDRAKIEDEFHLIFQCVSYTEMRANWLSKLKLPENFLEIEASEKLKIVLNEVENVKLTGQFIIDAFNYRSKIGKK